jgi:hypothetical protein
MRRRWLVLLLSVLASAIYSIGFRYVGALDAVPAELLPISLLAEGDLDFDEFQKVYEPLPYSLVPVHGRIVSAYPVVAGLFNVPAFAIARVMDVDLMARRLTLSKLTAIAITVGALVALFFALTSVTTDVAAFWFALLAAFGTSLWSVSSMALWQHGPSVLMLSLALAVLLRADGRWLPWAGFFLGCAVWARPSNLMIAVPLTVYVAWSWRRQLPGFLAGAAVPAVMMAVYAQVYWGSVMSGGAAYRPGGGGHGPFGAGLDGSLLSGLAGVLVSPSRGLFVFTPVLLFAWPAIARAWRSPLYGALAAGSLCVILLTAKWRIWWGGHSFGPRLLTDIVPILIIFLALSWRWIAASRIRLAGFAVAVVLSVYVQYLGAHIYPTGWNYRPTNIDDDPARLWDVRDTELGRAHRRVMEMIVGTIGGTRP